VNVGGPKQRQRTLGEGTVGDVKKDIKGLVLSVDMRKSGTNAGQSLPRQVHLCKARLAIKT